MIVKRRNRQGFRTVRMKVCSNCDLLTYSQRATESLQALKNDRETDAAGRLMTEPDSLVLALSSTPAGPGKRPALDAMAATQLVNASTKEGSSDVNHAAFIAVAEAGQSGTTNGK